VGHKTHPIGFRLGVSKDWQVHWFAGRKRDFRTTLYEDLKVRQVILSRYPGAGIARLEIERNASEVTITIHTARPGIIIGRQGQRVEELRQSLEVLCRGRPRINVQEVRQPEINASLVAQNLAEQLERRVAHRRAMVQATSRAMQGGALGIRVICQGRLGGAEIARREKVMVGRIPLHTLRANVDFAVAEALTVMGRIGVKVWIYLGEVPMRGQEAEAPETLSPIQVTVTPEEESGPKDAPAQTG
jgi:small subunit ribosomal protein S3